MTACPVCHSTDLIEIANLGEVPLFCNMQWATREDALAATKAQMHLVGCPVCSHHFNAAFEPARLQYAPAYDTSQHFSATFRAYAEDLARRLVETYDLRGKAVVDVGCGKGDLLKLICRLGGNRGFGFDVSYDGDPEPADAPGVRFRTSFFDADQSAGIAPELICCRHVLEHIADPAGFLRGLADTLTGRADRVLYLEVPNGELQLTDGLVWDYIYEHYSYFSATSLRKAIHDAGLEVVRLAPAFRDQFLCAEVRWPRKAPTDAVTATSNLSAAALVGAAAKLQAALDYWHGWSSNLPNHTEAIVLWGAGSKGVTFANLLDMYAPLPLDRMVDQNPGKQGRFVSGTGQVIVSPDSLVERRVDMVILMNEAYRAEVSDWLRRYCPGTALVSAMCTTA